MTDLLRTVLGDVDPSTMGGTLPHEHLLVDMDSWWTPTDDPDDDRTVTGSPRLEDLWRWQESPAVNRGNLHLTDEDLAVHEIKCLSEHGIGTIVEVSNVGLGRDVEGLRRIAERSGMNIVAGSSFYTADSLDKEVAAMSEAEMVDRIVGDILDGVDGTGIKAGVIGEVGLSWPLDDLERRSLGASVKAMHITGAAVTIHSPYYMREVSVLEEICELLIDLGADMSRVIMGHCDSFTRDPRFLEVVPELGCVLELDMFGMRGYDHESGFVYPSDEDRVEAIRGMVDAGLAERILLSHDVGFKTSLRAFGGHGYDYVPRFILPWLERSGVGDEAIEQIMVGNCRRILPLAPPTKSRNG
jgi:phosphotriesterase-related protein